MSISISAAFKDQEIFVTGGTGFVGKALIEKLLRSCPTLSRIYVLLRPKKGVAIESRLEALLNCKLYERLRREQPHTLAKVVPIGGDVTQLGLGISESDLKRLTNVTIVYHSAASVRFDDPLRDAILMNTRGTHELIKLALTWKKLRAFVHVSTTYSNPTELEVEERIYPPYADWRTTIKLAETYDEETLDVFNLKYGNFQPNTYTFTKSLAEHVANDYKDQLPIFIFRPSIVISTLEEPVPGWADNFNGPTGMLVACAVGILRSQNCDPNIVADFVPADVVVRGLILSSFKYLQEAPAKDQPIGVFNCATANISPITMGQVIDIGKRYIRQNPFEKTLWLPGGSITMCPVLHFLRFITMHIMMAIVVDFLLRLTNEKPFLLKLQRRIFAAFQALHIFAITEWHFQNDNFKSLHDSVPENEISIFGFMQYSNIDYVKFFRNGIRGAKEYLLHETPESSRGAMLRIKIFYVLDCLFRAIVYGFLLRIVYKLAVRIFLS
ncbi:putative fatty acyl-CoA reductase CG5065 [Drosophila grimshawi]|uniref:Fatty acyl-CoA reductase n=1 Tax=Drosophila grimshawi TaxID=7222 RepID=B4JM90_DROGR|nr:putative fatty acyl-CoA reductase CG5065 [Drosophila grimshawi]EDV91851.1 GH24373 [Drosophila grimshawi]